MVKLVLLLLVWLALPVSGGLYCSGGGYSHNKKISFSYTCLNETSSLVKVACQFTDSLGFKALRVNGIDQHCHSRVQPGLDGTEVSCSFPVSTVLTGSTFDCYSDVSGSRSFHITLFSDECIPPMNSRIVVGNSTVTFQCNYGFILESSRAVCQLQLHTDMVSSHWVPMLNSGCITNISSDNTPGNLNLVWLLLLLIVILLVGGGIIIRKLAKPKEAVLIESQSNVSDASSQTTDKYEKAERDIFQLSAQVVNGSKTRDSEVVTQQPTISREIPKLWNSRGSQSGVKFSAIQSSHNSNEDLSFREDKEIPPEFLPSSLALDSNDPKFGTIQATLWCVAHKMGEVELEPKL